MGRHVGVAVLLFCVGTSACPASAESLRGAALRHLAARRAEMLESLPSGQGAHSPAPALGSSSGKSLRKAFFLSLLLPGLGQRYLGQERRSQIYMAAELGTWITVGSFWLQGSLREDRYREYAAIVGGADPDDPDDEYYRHLALYSSSDHYATVIRWEARALYEDDLDAQRRYYLENIYPEDMAWSWPDKTSFDEYKELRRRSKRAYRSAVNSLALAVLNRLVSAVDAVTGQERRWAAGGLEPRVSVRALPGDDSPAPFFHLRQSF